MNEEKGLLSEASGLRVNSRLLFPFLSGENRWENGKNAPESSNG